MGNKNKTLKKKEKTTRTLSLQERLKNIQRNSETVFPLNPEVDSNLKNSLNPLNQPIKEDATGFFTLNKPILIILTVFLLIIIALLLIKRFRKKLNISAYTCFTFACTLIAIYLDSAKGKENINLFLFDLTPSLLCNLYVLLAAVNTVFASLILMKSSKDFEKIPTQEFN